MKTKEGNPTPKPDDARSNRKKRRRQANLYDAVAGRVSAYGFINPNPVPQKRHSDLVSSSTVPIRPDEALYKRKNAPTRYAETDHYFAHQHLAPYQELPDSDLLASIHAYASQYYTRMPRKKHSRAVLRSMDETALLTMGILIEEAAREALGETGDLAFVEGEYGGELDVGPRTWNGLEWARNVVEEEHETLETGVIEVVNLEDEEGPTRIKRRKTTSVPDSLVHGSQGSDAPVL